MKRLFLFFTFFTGTALYSQNSAPFTNGVKAFFSANFLNKNVYKTQDSLEVILLYKDDISSTKNSVLHQFKKDTFEILVEGSSFIRYKILKTEDKSTYIRTLKGCKISASKKEIRIKGDGEENLEDASNYVFKIAETKTPINHYLASSALVGMPMTLPFKIRRLDDNTKISGSFNISYAFGWKLKIGNNPFRNTYIQIIPYAAGLSVQKFFTRLEDGTFSDKVDEVALTYYSGGVAYQWEKFNFGVFLGFDTMLNDKNGWVYDDRGWLGFGLGYDLFKDD
jgi:hypothetical protein